jgi:sialic acid synthase SpsE
MNKMFRDLTHHGYSVKNRFYTIAEIGINHGGSLDNALKLIDSAAKTGVNSVKFQTYITEKRVSKDSSIFDILKSCELKMSDFELLKKHSNSYGLDFFSTPFDDESVDCLLALDIPFFKVASFDTVNHSLLKKLSEQKKPVIMSTGMSNLDEVKKALDILGNDVMVTLLHCVSAYPTREVDANLSVIDFLKDNFECVVGQSDHTPYIKTALYAFLRGAQVLEKHFKIDDSFECIDGAVSITETQMKSLVENLYEADQILGDNLFCATDAEKETLKYRRFSSI